MVVPEVMASAPSDPSPPKVPFVDTTYPLNVAEVAVRFPARSTRKGAVVLLAKVLPDQNAISEPAFPEFRPAALEPVPTVILAVLAAPEVRVRFVAVIVVAPMVKPPMVPVVAVIVPRNVPLLASRLPFGSSCQPCTPVEKLAL